MAKSLRVSVVVPAFNEEGAIRETLTELREHLADAAPYEIIVVDDGSTDGTWDELQQASRDDPSLRVLRHSGNYGYGTALKTGIAQAAGPLIAITDADGTYPNERLAELIERCEQGQAMVVGARTGSDVEYSKLRATAKVLLISYASWIARRKIPDINSGMRVFRRDLAIEFLPILPGGFSFTTNISLAMLTSYQRVEYVPINYRARVGKSKIKPIRDTLNFVALIARTGMYFAPLRVIAPVVALSLLGTFISLILDIFAAHGPNLTDTTVILFVLTMNAGMFGLLADMVQKHHSARMR
jgi:glycosyltransferase involved in cell wall biosynthesis